MAALLGTHPREQYEAAELTARRRGSGSGTSRCRTSPIIMFAVVTGVIAAMQYYTQPLVAGKVASGVIQGARDPMFEPEDPSPRSPSPNSSTTSASSASTTAPPALVALVLFALSMAFTACVDAVLGRPHPGR
ncbi:Sugar ABC transporter permease OS=Streptomyces alboniger OX=132473 GN=CP975_12115 PE=4 SV=1 [Streptomyces alboniger]